MSIRFHLRFHRFRYKAFEISWKVSDFKLDRTPDSFNCVLKMLSSTSVTVHVQCIRTTIETISGECRYSIDNVMRVTIHTHMQLWEQRYSN